MSASWEVWKSGVRAAAANPARQAATILALTCALTPYLTGLCAATARRAAADAETPRDARLIVAGRLAGRPAPLPLASGAALAAAPGVEHVRPRLRLRIRVDDRDGETWLQALDPATPRRAEDLASGRWCAADDECVVGARLARARGTRLGDELRGRALDGRTAVRWRVVGVLASRGTADDDACHATWSAVGALVGDARLVTDFLVVCRPGYEEALRREWTDGPLDEASVAAGVTRQVERIAARRAVAEGAALAAAGAWTLWFAPVLLVCVLVVSVTSGLALAERRREASALKSLGWSTWDVAFRATGEMTCASVAAAVLATALAAAWCAASPWGALRWTPTTIPTALLMSLLGGWLGGVRSAWRAALAPTVAGLR